ncbi:MAG TPA: hypothetical protein PLW44_15580 [Chitinophagales bacterium]|nr:hypothetical protein [Chitinophagales bacterium]
MKKVVFVLAAILVATIANAQSPKVIFDAEKIIFYGLDFSRARFSLPDAKDKEIKEKYLELWNQTVFDDNGRFPKESTFSKVTVYGDPTIVKRRNAAVDASNISGKAEKALTKEDAQEVINDYKDGMRKEGLGVVFLVESFNKAKKEGVALVVFFDIATRKVLLAKRVSGEPGGPGLTNYWAGAIQQMFIRISNTEYLLWRKEVTGK